jgi:hypothetical protein
MFASAGFFAAREQELMAATEHNAAGHWENLEVCRTNESVLGRLGGSWFDPPSEDRQLAARPWAVPELRSVFERVVDQAENVPVVLKDPRIGVMLPLWGEIIDHLHPVLVIRDPIEVALSLNRRDGSPTSFMLAAWQLHMTRMLPHLQRRVVTVAPYTRLLESSQCAYLVIGSTVRHLRDDLASRVNSESSLTALDPALHRSHVSPGDHERQMSVRQLELWSELASLDPGDQRIDISEDAIASDPAALSLVRAETERLAMLERVDKAEQASATERDRTEALTLELAAERERTEALTLELAAERERSEALSMHLAGERDRAAAAAAGQITAEGWLEAIQTSPSWRITAPLRAGKRTIRRLGRGARIP